MRDLIIVGLGPSGVSASIYSKRGGLDVLVIEKDAPLNKIMNLKRIDNYPGFFNISGMDLSMNFFNSFNSFDIPLISDEVLEIKKENNYFKVICKNNVYESKYVIIASGIIYKSSIKGMHKYLGKGVSLCAVCDGSFYKDKIIAYIGNDQEDINYLKPLVSKMYQFNQGNFEIVGEEKIIGLKVNDVLYEVDGIFIDKEITNNEIKIDNLNKNGLFIKTNKFKETSIENMFAVGDVSDNNLKQIVTAVSDGAIAASEIIRKKRLDN